MFLEKALITVKVVDKNEKRRRLISMGR